MSGAGLQWKNHHGGVEGEVMGNNLAQGTAERKNGLFHARKGIPEHSREEMAVLQLNRTADCK